MAEASSPGVLEQAQKAPMAFIDFCRKYWFMGPIIVLVLLGIGMALKPWFTNLVTTKDSANKGDKLPAALKSFLRISGLLVPIGFVLLGADVAFAGIGTCCAQNAAHSGWISQVFGFLGMREVDHVLITILGTGVAFGISHLSAPDVLDGVTMPGQGKSLSYTPGAAQELSLYMQTSTKNKTSGGQPLIAIDSTVALTTTVEQVSTGTNPILSQDLARLIDYLQISSLFHGTVLDKTTGTGPVLDLAINFVGQGFARWGDAPSVTITVPSSSPNDVALTKYFTFPWAQRILIDPSATCPWLGTLDNMRFQIGIAAATALAAVSTGANTKNASTVRLATSYAISPHWRQNYIPYARLDQPASGEDGLIFQNFGGTGPSASKAQDMMLGLAWLSNLAGLPGNMTFDNLTNLIAPDFGLEDVKALDMLVLARRKATQPIGNIGTYNLSEDGNYRQGTANNGAALDKLLMFWLRQPSTDMVPAMLPVFDASSKPKLRGVYTTPRVGPDAMLSLSLRELSQTKMNQQSAASGGQMPTVYRKAKHYKAPKGQIVDVA